MQEPTLFGPPPLIECCYLEQMSLKRIVRRRAIARNILISIFITGNHRQSKVVNQKKGPLRSTSDDDMHLLLRSNDWVQGSAFQTNIETK
jgi:hypothetical protein